MSVNFELFNKIVVRNPLFSQDEITFEEFKKNDNALMALYLASKTLYCEFSKKNSDTLNKSLYKYYLRSKYRPTPFGIFGSVSVSKFDYNTNVSFVNDNKSICHLKFDSSFILELTKKTDVKSYSLYYLNPTVHKFNGVYRYVNDFQDTSICEFKANTLIRKFLNLAKKGISFDSAINYFLSNTIDKEIAANFIQDLVNRKILLSSHSKLISHNSINFFKQKLNNPNFDKIDSIMYINQLKKLIEYENLISTQTDFNISSQNIFQVDFYRNAEKNNIGNNIKQKILDLIPFFFNCNLFETGNPRVQNFIKEFINKYDKQEILLLHALDPIIGIGYPVKSFDKSTNYLVKDIVSKTTSRDNKDSISEFENYLLNKISNSINVRNNEINLDDEKFKNIKLDSSTIPSTFSVICELLKDEKVFIKSIGGSTANSLLSRFSMFPELYELSNEIATYEKTQIEESKILVDVCFLPPGKENNVVSRDMFYDYYIYFNPWEGMDLNKAISLDEISIKIQGGKIILFCKKFNKEIMPILPSAHNYFKENTFFIYQFLCDIQGSKFSTSFSSYIENLLSILNHIPRIIYKQCVLSKEKWVIDINNFEITTLTKEQFKKSGYPDKFFIVEGDNELLIDFNEEIAIDIFYKTLKRKQRIIIEEFIEHYDGIRLNDSQLRNELIFSVKKI